MGDSSVVAGAVTTTEVLIAGAGPAGCTIALSLARRGVSVVLLEGEAELPLDLRASTFHPPTLDMLDELGVAGPLIAQGLIARTYQHRDRASGEAAIFDLAHISGDTRHPYRLQCEQYRMTQLICRMLAEHPHAQVRFDHRVEQVIQDGEGVSVWAETPGEGFRAFRARYVCGCDGAGSRVRKTQTIDFEGFTWPERFLVVSTPYDLARDLPNLSYVNYVSDAEQWCVLLKTASLWRVLVPVAPGVEDAEVLTDYFVQRVLHGLVDRAGDFEVRHRTLYRVHQRVAKTYRRGRVLLAGDAAHINNPLGGMGMNGGLHDAVQLASSLYAVLREGASEAVLDRYDRQRRGICVKFVQEQTIRNKRSIEERDAGARERQMAEYKRMAADPTLARQFLLKSSMIESLREAAAIP